MLNFFPSIYDADIRGTSVCAGEVGHWEVRSIVWIREEKCFLISHHPALHGAAFGLKLSPSNSPVPRISLNSVGAYKGRIIKGRYCPWQNCSEEKDAIAGRSHLAG